MKRFVCATALFVLPVLVLASGPVDGGWKGQIGSGDTASDIWLSLKTDNTQLSGSVTGVGSEASIQEGTVDGSTLRFKMLQSDGANALTINCIGSLIDDSISFSCTTEEETPQTQEFTVTRNP